MSKAESLRTVAIATASSTGVVLLSGSGTKIPRLHALHVNLATTGTLQVLSVTTSSTSDLTGVMSCPSRVGPNWTFVGDRDGVLKGAAGGSLQLSSTAAMSGYAIVSQDTV